MGMAKSNSKGAQKKLERKRGTEIRMRYSGSWSCTDRRVYVVVT